MENQKLDNKEEILLRVLYEYTEGIPRDLHASIFTENSERSLIDLGLVEEIQQEGQVIARLSEKGMKLVEDGGYIIKYPLASESGSVSTFLNVLSSMEPTAARALGKSIIASKLHVKWGKQVNLELFEILVNTIEYYRTFIHPVARLDELSNDISKAESRLEKELISEMAKIEEFTLPRSINLGLNSQNERTSLVGIIGNNLATFNVNGKEEVGNYLLEAGFYLPQYIKKLVIREYYISKSKQPAKAK